MRIWPFLCAQRPKPRSHHFEASSGKGKKVIRWKKGARKRKCYHFQSCSFEHAERPLGPRSKQAKESAGERNIQQMVSFIAKLFSLRGEESSNGLSTRNVKNSRSFVCLQTVMRHEWALRPSKTTVRTINVRQIIKCNPMKRAQPACLLIQPRDE